MNTRSKLVLLAIAAGLAACSDGATAPKQAAVEPSNEVVTGGSMQDLNGIDTIRFSITIEPWHTTYFYLGAGNSLVFPAGSLCDPYTSSYGAGQWDKPCNRTWSPLTVNVKAWLDKRGNPRVEFDKHVRFVPSTDPSRWVVLTFSSMEAAMNPFFNINYCPQVNSACYDESVSDPTLLTVRNPITGKITRRIKHFSGYNVAAGEDGLSNFSLAPGDLRFNSITEIESFYPTMTDGQAEGMLGTVRAARKSGYILASG